MTMSRNVTVIPARARVGNNQETESKTKLRVAAYCRVSTDSEEQASSYEVQIEHYTSYIKGNPEWELAGIYADVYNLKMIPFDTINAVQTPKITAFGGKTPVESRYFNFRKLFCLTAGFINAPSK